MTPTNLETPPFRFTPMLRVALLAAGGALALGGLLPAASAAPQDEQVTTWSMSPSDADGTARDGWLELDVEPGETRQEYLLITNHSQTATEFELQAADGYFTPSGRFNMQTSSEDSVDSGTWIEIADQVTVEAHGSQVVPFTITVPQNATPGDHAAGVASVITSTGTGADGNSIGVDSRVGFRVMTRVDGELNPALGFGQLAASYSQNWNPFQPGTIDLGLTLNNEGNVQLSPDLLAEGVLGAEWSQPDSGDLLPGATSTIQATIARAWPLGLTPLDVTVTAQVEGADTVLGEQRIWVWALPLPQLMVLAGICLIVWGARRRRRIQRHRMHELLEQARTEGAAAARETASGGVR